MALATNALTTLESVKEALSLTSTSNDAYITRLVNAASDLVESYCNRTFYYEAGISEKVAGYGRANLVVARRPILSITSITFDGSTVSSDDYEIGNANAGLIYSENGWSWTASVLQTAAPDRLPGSEDKDYTVTYTAGYVTPKQEDEDATLTRTLPYDLEDAAIRLVIGRYRNRGADPNIKSEKLGAAAVTYFDSGLSPGIKQILARYKSAPVS